MEIEKHDDDILNKCAKIIQESKHPVLKKWTDTECANDYGDTDAFGEILFQGSPEAPSKVK